MPNLFVIRGYKIYFWSDENNEPIHVHISKGKPTPNATKLWLTEKGGCIIAHNKSQIPDNELRDLSELIVAQYFVICAKWKEFFRTEKIVFYC